MLGSSGSCGHCFVSVLFRLALEQLVWFIWSMPLWSVLDQLIWLSHNSGRSLLGTFPKSRPSGVSSGFQLHEFLPCIILPNQSARAGSWNAVPSFHCFTQFTHQTFLSNPCLFTALQSSLANWSLKATPRLLARSWRRTPHTGGGWVHGSICIYNIYLLIWMCTLKTAYDII